MSDLQLHLKQIITFSLYQYITQSTPTFFFSDIVLNCTLWEEYAGKFIQYNSNRKEGGPVVVMLKTCKIKEEGFLSILLFIPYHMSNNLYIMYHFIHVISR